MLKESVKDESVYLPQDMRWMLANELEYLLSGIGDAPAPSKQSRAISLGAISGIDQTEGVHWLSRKSGWEYRSQSQKRPWDNEGHCFKAEYQVLKYSQS